MINREPRFSSSRIESGKGPAQPPFARPHLAAKTFLLRRPDKHRNHCELPRSNAAAKAGLSERRRSCRNQTKAGAPFMSNIYWFPRVPSVAP